jgi:hypothetical protein
MLKLYRRFVDDIFAIFICSLPEVKQFFAELNELEPTIKLTSEISSSQAIMLDLEFSKGVRYAKEGKLDVKTYQKPMNRYSYLPARSYHSDAMKLAFMKGEAIRYVRTNSDSQTYQSLLLLFRERLLARGYTNHFISKGLSEVCYGNRSDYLQTKEKGHDIPLLFHMTRNPAIDNHFIRSALDQFIDDLKNDAKVPDHMSRERVTLCVALPPKLNRRILSARKAKGL